MSQNDLREMMKEAMRAKDAVRLGVIRGLMTAVTNDLVSKGKKPTDELSEEDLLALVRRARKQRKDSIEQFEKGGRADLAEKEKEELVIIETMLPQQMPEAEVEAAAKTKAAELGITDVSKKNQLMGALMRDLKGRADGDMVKVAVDKLFL
jgi:uncharacterized protein YqeY